MIASSNYKAAASFVEAKKHQTQNNKSIYTKLPQRESKLPLIRAIRRVRPCSRKSGGELQRKESFNSNEKTSSRPIGYLMKAGYQKSYSGRLNKISQDMRMKKIEEKLVKWESQQNLSTIEKKIEWISDISWRAFAIIVSLFAVVLAIIFYMEMDFTKYSTKRLPIFQKVEKMKIQRKEKLPVIQMAWVKFRDLYHQIWK